MKLWGGNYSGDPDKAFWEFNQSFRFDRRLLKEEIAASGAYLRALARAGCVSAKDATALERALGAILKRAQADPAFLETNDEDIHSFVEARLQETVGDLAGQAHMGRSRNEQAVTALRLWILKVAESLQASIARLVRALADQGVRTADAVMPGFTHTRPAEPITWGHLLASHVWGLVRDFDRLGDVRRRTSVLPLGSGALAGSALPLDRSVLASELGFLEASENALDAVTDRDFASEFVFACAQTQTHLARLSEDLIWFSSPAFGYVALPEAFTTGSSLMPQKKNPDSLELIRGKSARIDGDLLRLLVLMKGLPSGYQKDLQEDKEAVFDAADTLGASLEILTALAKGLTVDREAMEKAAGHEEMMAAGLAVALAREGTPFRKAHTLVGSWVETAQKTRTSLQKVAGEALGVSWKARLAGLFDPKRAVAAKSLQGGTSPSEVKRSLGAARLRVVLKSGREPGRSARAGKRRGGSPRRAGAPRPGPRRGSSRSRSRGGRGR